MDDDGRMSETSSVHNRGRGRNAPSPMAEMDDGCADHAQPAHIRPQMRCNACWEVLLANQESAQTCYRTSCSHLFCEKCAYKHFGGGRLVCPACRTDINSTRGGGVFETTIHGIADAKRTEAIWEEMIANPSSCFEHFQRALDFIMYQLAQDSYRQEELRRQMAEENKTFQRQHGEKYIQLKNYADQVEAELRETKTKMQGLNTSNEELREAYKEKSRKCRNWEKMCKALKSQQPQGQNGQRQYPSPVGSTTSMNPVNPIMHQEGSLVSGSSPYGRMVARPMVRTAYQHPGPSSGYQNPGSTSGITRPHVGGVMRPETPGRMKRPNVANFERFQRPQLGGGGQRPMLQAIPTMRQRIVRPKTPLQLTQRTGFLSKSLNDPNVAAACAVIDQATPLFEFTNCDERVTPCASIPPTRKVRSKHQISPSASTDPEVPFTVVEILGGSHQDWRETPRSRATATDSMNQPTTALRPRRQSPIQPPTADRDEKRASSAFSSMSSLCPAKPSQRKKGPIDRRSNSLQLPSLASRSSHGKYKI